MEMLESREQPAARAVKCELGSIFQNETGASVSDWLRKSGFDSSIFFSQFSEYLTEGRDVDAVESESKIFAAVQEQVGTMPINLSIELHDRNPCILKEILSEIKSEKRYDENHYEMEKKWYAEDAKGYNPITLAILKDNVDILEMIISAGAVVPEILRIPKENRENLALPILSICLAFNSLNMFQFFIRKGFSHDIWDSTGQKPIHICIENGNLEALKALLKLENSKDITGSAEAQYKFQIRQNFEDIEKLIDEEVSTAVSENNSSNPTSAPSEAGSGAVTRPTTTGENAVWEEINDDQFGRDSEEDEDSVSESEHFLELEDILELEREMEAAGFEIHRDRAGNITARFRGRQEGYMISERLERNEGSNLLHVACSNRQKHIVNYLLSEEGHLQNVNDVRVDGMAAVHIAARNNDVDILQRLQASNADLNIVNDILGMAPIHLSSESGSLAATKFLLDHGVNPEVEDDNGFVPLHYCATNDESVDIMTELLSVGCDPNKKSNDGETPIYTAISRWNLAAFWKLLRNGADPGIPHSDGTVVLGFISANSMDELANFSNFVVESRDLRTTTDFNIIISDDGQTSLHVACKEQSLDAISALLKAGADPNVADENGCTPLLELLRSKTKNRKEQYRAAQELLGAGARVDVASNDGNTVLHAACQGDNPSILEVLASQVQNLDVKYNSKTALMYSTEGRKLQCMKILLNAGASPDTIDQNYMSPLLASSKKHSLDALQLLLSAGANVNQLSDNGTSCLHISSERPGKDVARIIESLCQNGADVNLKNQNGESPIHSHLQKGRTDGVRALIGSGCDINMFSEIDQSPLMTACDTGNIAAVRLLLSAGAQVNLRNKSNHTAMYYFADDEKTTIRIMRLLLSKGAILDQQDKDGDTVVHEAALGNKATVVRFLMQKGAAISVQNNEMETPLFQASRNGFVETVEVLLSAGGGNATAVAKMTDIHGTSPYEIARKNGHTEVMKTILKHLKVTLSSFAPISNYNRRSPSSSNKDMNSSDGQIESRTICAICQEALVFGDQIRRLPCKHVFHDLCILRWIGGEDFMKNNTCPICKQAIAPRDL